MQPTGELRGDAVRVGGDARQRFYDSRGYGRPLSGNEIALSRIEAAHLLFRGDLSGVVLEDGGAAIGFERFFVASAAAAERFAVRYLVYADLRDRGFYLSPTRDRWPGGDDAAADAVDFVVYERGSTPDTGDVRYPVQVVGERQTVPAAGLAGRTLAVVDEESDLTYFAATQPDVSGGTDYTPPTGLAGALLEDRVVVWDAPDALYDRGFYGRPLTGRAAEVEGALQLSLVEAASLAADGALSLSRTVGRRRDDGDDGDRGTESAGDTSRTADDTNRTADDASRAAAAVIDRGRAVEGDRFDRRLAVYRRLRNRRVVPKTGFKFGADFRTYLDVDTVDDLPHSEHLVRVVEPDHTFEPRELSLDVRLAGGVRKEMVFAMADAADGSGDGDDAGGVEWLSVSRLTP
ncbi:tRNA-intron lyase [Halorubrum sp. JWXQ-INN 858]|uniref:tRNA-intron lyase n=1 Tax=Halorubrum sp. JWXQ-INN 858 TaxID=2690782 RepID=UPI00135B389E|nr:tRNA-intron lyase [Halorubrum sp. JWXQ-INN 858]MWV64160.1 tRNA-intron lyase [Halorubrum sp. JWXQ-INN 858]